MDFSKKTDYLKIINLYSSVDIFGMLFGIQAYFFNSDQTFWFLMKDKVNYCCATIKMPHIPLEKNSKENTQKSFGSMMLCFVIWNRDNRRGQKEIGVVKMIQFLFLKVQCKMYIVDRIKLKPGRSLKYFCCLTSMNK